MPALIGVFAVGAYGYGAAPARQRRARQRGRPRPRLARRDRRHGPGLHRRLLAVPRHLPGRRPGRGAALGADQRRLLRRRRHGLGARRAPGRSGQGPRPRRRVRLAADDPGRDRGGRAPGRDRPPARSTGTSRAPSRTPRRSRSEARPSCSAARSPASRTSAAGRRGDVDVVVAPIQFGQQLSDRVVGPLFFGDTGQLTADMTDTYIRHTIVDQLTFDPNWGSTGSLATDGAVHPRVGLRAACCRSTSSARSRGRRATSCTTCRPTSRSSGKTTFRGDLLRSSTIDAERRVLQQGPVQHQLRARAARRSPTGRSRSAARSRRPSSPSG